MTRIEQGPRRLDLFGARDEIAVFLIGARINKPWKVHQWWPVLWAMPRMLRELQQRPELGFLGCEQWLGRATVMVQYWLSMDHLMRYAHAATREHLPAWRDFYRRARTDAVGIWHEAYPVRPAEVNATYVNMPPFGLGRFTGALETASRADRPRRLAV